MGTDGNERNSPSEGYLDTTNLADVPPEASHIVARGERKRSFGTATVEASFVCVTSV